MPFRQRSYCPGCGEFLQNDFHHHWEKCHWLDALERPSERPDPTAEPQREAEGENVKAAEPQYSS
jgi:hypothetical protein